MVASNRLIDSYVIFVRFRGPIARENERVSLEVAVRGLRFSSLCLCLLAEKVVAMRER